MKTSGYTIGKLAQAAGVNVETIRYYQRVGLMREPGRPVEGYRRYPEQAVARLRFIKRAQRLGFTLKEIADLLQLEDGKCKESREIAEEKRALIASQINDLTAMRMELDKLIGACKRKGNNDQSCALIDTLAKTKD